MRILTWPLMRGRPQLFKFPGVAGFPPQKRIDLSSNFREPGDNSYVRETVGYELMRYDPPPGGPPAAVLRS